MLHPARRLWRRRGIGQPSHRERWSGGRPARAPAARSAPWRRPSSASSASAMCPASRSRRATSTTCARATLGPLAAVFEHNRLDLLSLAALTAIAAQMADEGPGRPPSPHEALAMGQIYARLGRWAEADACFSRAAGLGDAPWDAALGRCEHQGRRAAVSGARAPAPPSGPTRRTPGSSCCERASTTRPRRKPGGPWPSTTNIAITTSPRRGSSPSTPWRRNRIPAAADALRHRLARLERKLGRSERPPHME